MGGVEGSPGLDGAFRSHWLQLSLMFLISVVIPGQKTEDSALAIMPLVPWWAEWRVDSTLDRRAGGTNTRSLYKMTPSIEVRLSLN